MNPIKEYFENYKDRKYRIPLSDGFAESIGEFYDKCISPTVLAKDVVLAWHKMLMEYVERDDAVFLIRRYENGSKESGRWNTRRSAQTRFLDGFTYVFVSNYDAHEIYNMASKGIVPSAEEFAELLKNHEYCLHYDNGKTKSCEEYDISAYPNIGNVRAGVLSESNWYLAHIYAVNGEYINEDAVLQKISKEEIEYIFPRGELDDWSIVDGYCIRQLDYSLSDYQKRIVKAHFLRLIDPINYFLTPSEKNYMEESGHYNKRNIGEHHELVEYVKMQHKILYGSSVFQQYVGAVLSEDVNLNEDYGKKPLRVYFGVGIRKIWFTKITDQESTQDNTDFSNEAEDSFEEGKLIQAEKEISSEEYDKAKCLYDYLFKGLSFRALEKENLNIDAKSNGGGFVAQKIIREFGILNESKGCFKDEDIHMVREKTANILDAIDYILDQLEIKEEDK